MTKGIQQKMTVVERYGHHVVKLNVRRDLSSPHSVLHAQGSWAVEIDPSPWPLSPGMKISGEQLVLMMSFCSFTPGTVLRKLFNAEPTDLLALVVTKKDGKGQYLMKIVEGKGDGNNTDQ
jgi:hypothetical protein